MPTYLGVLLKLKANDPTWWESRRCYSRRTRGRTEPSETSLLSFLCLRPCTSSICKQQESKRRWHHLMCRTTCVCGNKSPASKAPALPPSNYWSWWCHQNRWKTLLVSPPIAPLPGAHRPGAWLDRCLGRLVLGVSWCPPAIDRVCHQRPILPHTGLIYNDSLPHLPDSLLQLFHSFHSLIFHCFSHFHESKPLFFDTWHFINLDGKITRLCSLVSQSVVECEQLLVLSLLPFNQWVNLPADLLVGSLSVASDPGLHVEEVQSYGFNKVIIITRP